MSLYVTWINTIKEKADETWLTQSQRKAYETILTKWQSHSFVNLYGKSGVGKSFIARLLAKIHGYYYTHNLNDVPDNTIQVVLDGVEYNRQLRSIVRERNLGRVILITQNVVKEAMPYLSVELSDKDVSQFKVTLNNKCNVQFIYTVPEGTDLGKIMREEVIHYTIR